MPGITMMRPQNEVHVVRVPPGIHPPVEQDMTKDKRDEVVFSGSDRRYFHIEKILGQGGFGVAVRVRVMETSDKFRKGELIVIKQARITCGSDKPRYLQEYNIGRTLGHHENIVEMFACRPDCFDGMGEPCVRLFMRYCNAGSLKNILEIHRMARQPLPENFIWYTFASMGYALARMHNGLRRDTQDRPPDWIGYVHYDIKSDNVLLNWSSSWDRIKNPYPTPKLADFGCCGLIGRTAKWHGHTYYRAPEICSDTPRPCMPEADIWALGLMIYEMMEFTDAFPILPKRKHEWADFNRYRHMRSRYHPRLKNLVERCLDMDYRYRPDAEEIVMECKKFKRDIEKEIRAGYRPYGGNKLLLTRPR